MSLRFHTLRREQWIPRPIDEVFAFFADARNLEEITPPWIGFRILAMVPAPFRKVRRFVTVCEYMAYRFTGGPRSASGQLRTASLTCRSRDRINYGTTRAALKRTRVEPK